MKLKKNFFFKKKILIYGLGKSGSACFDFLNRNNDILVFDDNFTIKNKKYIISNFFVWIAINQKHKKKFRIAK